MYPVFYSSTIRSTEVRQFSLGGQQMSFNLPRESVIEAVDVVVEGIVSTAATQANVEGLPALISQVQLRGSLAGSGEVMPISSCTGPDLYELAQFKRGVLTPLVGALNMTGPFRLVIPIYFRNFFLGDKLDNMRTALPAFAMSSLSLNLTTATQNEVDKAGSPTFALTNANVWLRVHQCYRDSVPDGFGYLRSFTEVVEDNAVQTQSPRTQFLPAANDYSLILVRSFAAANGKQHDTNNGPFTIGPGQFLNLYDLNRRQKVGTSFADLRAQNIGHTVDPLIQGNACFVFNRGKESLFQTGEIGKSQTNILIEYNATTPAAGGRIRWVYERIEDSSNVLQIPRIGAMNA
jgi:hypothetical protein